jgi:2-alkenal reductase
VETPELPTPTAAPGVASPDFPTAPPPAPPSSSGGGYLTPDLVALYERVNPGVVAILVYPGSPGDSTIPTGQGSGFVVDSEGHIVTNHHVIEGAGDIEIDFPSGYKAWASIVGSDTDSDLAVLDVDVPQDVLSPLPLADSDALRVGEVVVAIGNPFGLSGTMTVGIVSALGRTLQTERTTGSGAAFRAGAIIQTDAAINPGNSGGPLINLNGEVVGVNRAIRTEAFTVTGDAANSGVGFAIPSNLTRAVVEAIIEGGSYQYPYLGISSPSEEAWNLRTLEEFGLPPDVAGVYITCVTPGGPADLAGIRGATTCSDPSLAPGGDLIVAIGDHTLSSMDDLVSYLVSHTQVGEEVTLTVLREGEEVEVAVSIGARP